MVVGWAVVGRLCLVVYRRTLTLGVHSTQIWLLRKQQLYAFFELIDANRLYEVRLGTGIHSISDVRLTFQTRMEYNWRLFIEET